MKFALPTIALFGAVASVSAFTMPAAINGENAATAGIAAGSGYAGYEGAGYLTKKLSNDTKYEQLNRMITALKDNEKFVRYAGAAAGAALGYQASPRVKSGSKYVWRKSQDGCRYTVTKGGDTLEWCSNKFRSTFRRKNATPAQAAAEARADAEEIVEEVPAPATE